MKFGDKLSRLRRKNGLSQEELGYQLNVTRQTISKWELGQSKPDTDKLKEISKLLNVDFNQLADDEAFIEDNVSDIDENTEEIRPRKWLLVVLIVIALILVIVLASKYVTDKKEKEEAEKDSIFDIFDGFGDMIDSENMSTNAFNSTYEMRSGTNLGSLVSSLLDDVITNNKKSDEHLISVVYDDINTTNSDEIKDLKKKINSFSSYEVSLDYAENGYVNKITIETSVSEFDIKMFNSSLEVYAGSNFGTTVTMVLDTVITSNKKNSDKLIKVVYGSLSTTDENEIRGIKKGLDDWTKYDVIFDYDDVGYINQVTITN